MLSADVISNHLAVGQLLGRLTRYWPKPKTRPKFIVKTPLLPTFPFPIPLSYLAIRLV